MALESPLLALPKELRLEIYERVYTQIASSSAVSLLNLQPPSENLLLACRTTHSEAKVPYQQCHRTFWTASRFELALERIPPALDVQSALLSLPTVGFGHVNHLQIFVPQPAFSDPAIANLVLMRNLLPFAKQSGLLYDNATVTLVHNRGGWHILRRNEDTGREMESWRRYRVSTWRAGSDQPSVIVRTAAAWDAASNGEELYATCEKFSRGGGNGVSLRNQLFHLLKMELVDEGAGMFAGSSVGAVPTSH